MTIHVNAINRIIISEKMVSISVFNDSLKSCHKNVNPISFSFPVVVFFNKNSQDLVSVSKSLINGRYLAFTIPSELKLLQLSSLKQIQIILSRGFLLINYFSPLISKKKKRKQG